MNFSHSTNLFLKRSDACTESCVCMFGHMGSNTHVHAQNLPIGRRRPEQRLQGTSGGEDSGPNLDSSSQPRQLLWDKLGHLPAHCGKNACSFMKKKKVWFISLIKHSLKEFMTIAQKRRMGKEKANHTFLILTKKPKKASPCLQHDTLCLSPQKPRQALHSGPKES